MSNPSPLAPVESGKLAANQAILRGRVLEVKRTEDKTYTVITLPAPDSFSSPQNVEVRSDRLLGKPQEDITLRVVVGGYRRSYKNSHGETQYATNITLVAIED